MRTRKPSAQIGECIVIRKPHKRAGQTGHVTDWIHERLGMGWTWLEIRLDNG